MEEVALVFPKPDHSHERIKSRDDADHREAEQDYQAPGVAPGHLLVVKEIHRHWVNVP